ncbi:MAG: DUF1552 domain-containing protein [Planctomycetota bacterium]
MADQKSWHLDRRSFLRGAGVACALPYLEAMEGAAKRSVGDAPRRMCFVSFPNGAALPDLKDDENRRWRWFPDGEGEAFEFTDVLRAMEPFRKQLSIHGGLSHPLSRELLGHLAGDTWLTAGDARFESYKNRISVDQVAAAALKAETRYPSIALSSDGGVGYKSRVSTLSFDRHGKPIPAESQPRLIFERYFAGQGGTSVAERRQSLGRGKRVVDLVLEDSKQLHRRLGTADQRKLDEFLGSLSQVEEQIERNESWLDRPMKPFDASGIELDALSGVDPNAYLRSMLDLIVLAFETDLTRVATFQMAREDGMGPGDKYPSLALGIKKGHHTISHDNAKGHWEEWGRLDQWYANHFAHFIGRLAAVSDEHGPLLDRSQVLYGSCCSTTHNARNYPLLVGGGTALGIKHGRYTVHDEKHTPMSNLLLSMLRAGGIEAESFGDSTGPLADFA